MEDKPRRNFSRAHRLGGLTAAIVALGLVGVAQYVREEAASVAPSDFSESGEEHAQQMASAQYDPSRDGTGGRIVVRAPRGAIHRGVPVPGSDDLRVFNDAPGRNPSRGQVASDGAPTGETQPLPSSGSEPNLNGAGALALPGGGTAIGGLARGAAGVSVDRAPKVVATDKTGESGDKSSNGQRTLTADTGSKGVGGPKTAAGDNPAASADKAGDGQKATTADKSDSGTKSDASPNGPPTDTASSKTADTNQAGTTAGTTDESIQPSFIKVKATTGMDWDPQQAHRSNGELFIMRNTTLQAEADLTAPATSISLWAHADKAGGEWPRVRVTVDGTPMGEVVVNSAQEKKFYIPIWADPGHRVVELSYINDFYDPQSQKDRNLYVRQVKIRMQPQGK